MRHKICMETCSSGTCMEFDTEVDGELDMDFGTDFDTKFDTVSTVWDQCGSCHGV